TASKINKYLGKTGQFWQEQYYEHRIRKEENLLKIVGYCRENPMRRGLAMEPESCPFWKFKPENI
ncbi:MAG: hypothetical protein LWY06_05075, partial [Firmicutes bacterium]|nr:hypothetical protein [Bacillota bacterium]